MSRAADYAAGVAKAYQAGEAAGVAQAEQDRRDWAATDAQGDIYRADARMYAETAISPQGRALAAHAYGVARGYRKVIR